MEDVRADVKQNTRDIVDLKQCHKEMKFKQEDMERKQYDTDLSLGLLTQAIKTLTIETSKNTEVQKEIYEKLISNTNETKQNTKLRIDVNKLVYLIIAAIVFLVIGLNG